MIVDKKKFENAIKLLGLKNSASPEEVIRAHLDYEFNKKGVSGIGLSADACGIDCNALSRIFTEYKFEIHPQYGKNWRTV